MKKLLTFLLLLCRAININGDSWVQKGSYPGLGRAFPFSFSIGSKGYVGCGMDSTQAPHSDFWEYDPSSNAWTQKANFGGGPRWAGSGFAIGNKGYAGLGIGSPFVYFQDFWEFDPFNNVWTQKADFGGGYRAAAIGFAIGYLGYMGTGADTVYVNDLWQYDPVTDTWLQKTSLPGTARDAANCFVIGNNGYVVAGYHTGTYLSDLWEYNSITDNWLQRANFPSTSRSNAAAFSICDKGYFGMGEGFSPLGLFFNDLWQYNPVTNVWIQQTNFIGTIRKESAYFSIGNKGYIGLGENNYNSYNDFYEYTPDSLCATGITDLASSSNLIIYPNPAKEEFTVYGLQLNKNVEIKIFDSKGKTVLTQHQHTAARNLTLPIANLPAGIYLVQVSDAENKVVRKLVVE